MQTKKIWLPDIVGGGYGQFWYDQSRYRVLKGGKGSKKSTTTALNYLVRLMDERYSAANLLVVRNVCNTHRDSTFAILKWAQQVLGVAHLWQNTVSPMEMCYLPTGQRILFRGFDDALKLASITVPKGYLCWVWIEEAFELGSEGEFDKLDLSVPRSKVPPPLFNQTTLTFNPWSENHWLKGRFFDTHSPLVSTYTTNYMCNEHLTDEFYELMEQMKKSNRRKYNVAGLGEWGIAEGLIYENWEIQSFEPRTLGETDNTTWQYRHFFGLDYGYTNDPTAFIAFAVNPIKKQIYIYDEHYQARMLNCDIADMIKRKGFAKERIRADSAEPKSNEDLRRMGIARLVPSVKGKDSVINGITKIQEYRIFVHPRCKNTITELSSYCWKKDKNENGLNAPEDRNNHLCDALRYAFYDVRYFRPENPDKPKVKPTQQQYYYKKHGLKKADFKRMV